VGKPFNSLGMGVRVLVVVRGSQLSRNLLVDYPAEKGLNVCAGAILVKSRHI